MIDHCRRIAPLEACGILAGRGPVQAESIYPLRNALRSATRYNADSRDLIRAIETMRGRGEEMLAIYHSHPASLPIPSPVDLAWNYYGPLPRIIVSLMGEDPMVRIWRLEESDFTEVAWSIRAEIEPEGPSG
jgi:proteasome lid subunit RPN8/RPN11